MANWSGTWSNALYIWDDGTPVDPASNIRYTFSGYYSIAKWTSASIYGTSYNDIVRLDSPSYSTARLAGPWYFSLGGGNDVLDLTSKRFYYGGVEAHGGSGNDWLLGNYGSDQLWGDSGNDVLKGYGGADYLNGGTGADAMYGGRGNDTYVVDNYGDRVFEYANEGYDTVRVYNINYTLGYSQEALELKGTYNINGVGNTKDNVITGNEGYNRLTGGGGNDTFVFNTALKSWNWDTITDFGHSSDTIKLENAVFTGLSAGWLASIAFKDVTLGAVDRTDRIIYNFNTGDLYFDRDGSGTAYRAVKFAHVTPGTFLDASDFYVF